MEQFAYKPVFFNLVVLWKYQAVIDFVFDASCRPNSCIYAFDVNFVVVYVLEMACREVVLSKDWNGTNDGNYVYQSLYSHDN